MLSRISSKLRPSPSMCVSLLALVIALGGAGVAATGGNFILGQNNSAATRSTLDASVPGVASLWLVNNSTAANSTALALNVAAGKAPLKVNSTAKVVNLNADGLDGLNSTAFARVGSVDAQTLDGIDSSSYARATSNVWRYIGDPGEPAFENGWRNYDTTTLHRNAQWQHAAYRKDQFGRVELRGMVAGGVAGMRMFVLPIEYCPWFYHVYPVISNNVIGKVTVTYVSSGAGCSVLFEVGSNVWVGLDGISWEYYEFEMRAAAQSASLPNSSAAGQGITSLKIPPRYGPAIR